MLGRLTKSDAPMGLLQKKYQTRMMSLAKIQRINRFSVSRQMA
jgi:hypothetical protein